MLPTSFSYLHDALEIKVKLKAYKILKVATCIYLEKILNNIESLIFVKCGQIESTRIASSYSRVVFEGVIKY